MNDSLDGDRFIDPLLDLEEYEAYDARLGRTPMQLNDNRPIVRQHGEDIAEPTLEEGVSFVQKMAKGPPYV